MTSQDGTVTSSTGDFDPFAIRADHPSHSRSTLIVRLEESGRAFCPICLQNSTTEEVNSIDYGLFDRYTRMLFEILDENCANNVVRRILLPILEIILKRRSLKIRSDQDFHNLLKIIDKVRSDRHFNRYEFVQLARIFSSLSSNFQTQSIMPMLSVWQASINLMDYAEIQIGQLPQINMNEELMLFFDGLALIVSSYLKLLRSFAVDKISDLIFPLSKNDDPQAYCRQTYKQSLNRTLAFTSEKIIPSCWPCLVEIEKEERPLTSSECDFVSNLFKTFEECLMTAVRMDDKDFVKSIIEIDCLNICHHLIYRNQDQRLKSSIRSFLRKFVEIHIDTSIGIDSECQEILRSHEFVETNYKNAMKNSGECLKGEKTIFYLMVNWIALEHKSTYFSGWRVARVIKCLPPDNQLLESSKTAVSVYLLLISTLLPNLDDAENGKSFLKRLCKKSRGHSTCELNDIICSNDRIFFWLHEWPVFRKVVGARNIMFLLNRAIERETLEKTLDSLLISEHYTLIFQKMLRDDESIEPLIMKLAENCYNDESQSLVTIHQRLITYMSALLPAHLHGSILEFLNDIPCKSEQRMHRLIRMIVCMMSKCKHFHLMLDEQFIQDLFIFQKRLCEVNSSVRREDTVILLNNLIQCALLDNDPHIMEVIKCLEYYSLGYMYLFIADYTEGDRLAESVASLLITYDELDYPLLHNICISLYPMRLSILNWMLSSNESVQVLSLRLAHRLMENRNEDSLRACIATGLIHMIKNNPKLFRKQTLKRTVLPIATSNEFLYNPLIEIIVDEIPEFIKEEMDLKLGLSREPSVGPELSFISSSNSEDGNASIDYIISRLDDDCGSDSYRIPDSIYLSSAVQDQHSFRIDTNEWERRAHEINQSSDL